MRTRLATPFQAAALCTVGLLLLAAATAASPALLSAPAPGQQPPSGGNGDSLMPVISPDGRFVLFASSANNLVTDGATNPFAADFPARLNVYLRDRVAGTTLPVSVSADGTRLGNGDSLPAMISTNGRYALFESQASNLVAGDTNGSADVFLRDMLAGTTLLVSANTNGLAPNGASRSPVMTPDAGFVAFVSEASDLVGGDTNGIADVFVRDVQAGVTTLASPGATSTRNPAQPSASESPLITPDGRFIAFYSTATNLVTGAVATTNASDIYVRDRIANVTIWASSGAQSAFPFPLRSKLHCSSHTLSDDGQFVAYVAAPDPANYYLPPSAGVILRYNLQTGLLDLIHTNAWAPTPPYQDARPLDMTPDGRFVAFVGNSSPAITQGDSIYVWDADTGTNTLASSDGNGQVQTNGFCQSPVLDSSGRFVAYLSNGAGLVTNSLQGDLHAYLRDLQLGTTALLDSDSNGVGSGVSAATAPRLDSAARTVFFECTDGTLFPNDRNHALDLVAWDATDGSIELISQAASALLSASANGHSAFGSGAISADGRFLAFVSEADNLVANDTNGCADIFVRDLVFGTNTLVSTGTNSAAADGSSSEPCMDGSGRYVAFTSMADNLVSNDANHALDVFVRDLTTGSLTLGSVNLNGNPGNGPSMSPVLSRDGRFLLFKSTATDLAQGTVRYYGLPNLLLRDLEQGVTYVLTTGSVSSGVMTPDGRFVAVAGNISGTTSQLGLWDSQAGAFVYTNTIPGIFQLALSPDGQHLIYSTNGVLEILDWALNTNWSISAFLPCSHPGFKFSSDGRFMTFSAPNSAPPGTNAILNVFVYDFQTLSNSLISRPALGAAADGQSDSPDITPDGRFVAYRSLASNIVPGTTNGTANVFLYDRWTGATTLLSTSQAGNSAPNGISIQPTFSGDGRTLVFESWASDIASNDFNQSEDLFAVNLLYAAIEPASSPNPGFTIAWQAIPGQSYTVQFKQNLSDPAWQNATGPITNIDWTTYFYDAARFTNRFYRILAQ